MYTLILTATSTASANGSDTNTATAILMNGNQYVSGETIEFRLLTGSAIFSDGTPIKQVTTNSLGAASVEYTDTVGETISILAIMKANATVYSTATSSFDGNEPAPVPELKVTRVYNENDKTFSSGGPHYLFIGAKFYIELNEVSSSTVWGSNDANVAVKNVNGLGYVTIKGTPASSVVRITFEHASGSGSYDVACNLYIDNIHAEYEPKLTPNKSEFLAIYNEWGDMSTFDWGTGKNVYYYYARKDSVYSYVIDMSTGSESLYPIHSCDSATKLTLTSKPI
ncbi:Ig-like domain-containing protein [Lonsdalea iberica]|uniref:Big-1 domain-containing protein n=1 Tax=Lonsdalea iberica TaxID=1082703 RepID=A0A1X3RP95_9GAMM|nr:Ig-like domain-containing protein [Lonsdalea iberica]OSN03448.1 hypothetical protein AU511_14855 [Lonsdalea iberica]